MKEKAQGKEASLMTTARTTKPSYEHVQYDARPTAYNDSSEQGHPSLCEERPDECVTQCECKACHADSDDEHTEDEGDRSV